MSDFELVILGGSAIFALVYWIQWYADLVRVNPFNRRTTYRLALAVTPPLCLLGIYVALVTSSAATVRASAQYILFYLLLGAGWTAIGSGTASLLGLSVLDDVLERSNSAALWPCLAVLASAALIYAGGNVGEGPGPEAVFLSAGLAMIAWLLLWLAYERLTRVAEKITVERQQIAGWKLASLLFANAMILGVGAAGDWHPDTFVVEFLPYSLAASLLTVLACVFDRNIERSWPAAFYIFAGIAITAFDLLRRR